MLRRWLGSTLLAALVVLLCVPGATYARAESCGVAAGALGGTGNLAASCRSDAVEPRQSQAKVETWAEYVERLRRLWLVFIQRLPECTNQGQAPGAACPFVPPEPGKRVPGISEAEVAAYARQASTRLRLPEPAIVMAPDPAANEWNMAVVGLPVWLSIPDTASRQVTESSQGLTLRLSATFESVRFDLGDGSSVTCRTMPAYFNKHFGESSPSCGHTYTRPSVGGTYAVRATATWTVTWSAAGFDGTFPVTTTFVRQVKVGELQAVLVKR